uniref:Uncharacterized protein n=1 Tax=Salmo trutta TaxID=8032 RepID=A0A674F6E0_SALTR
MSQVKPPRPNPPLTRTTGILSALGSLLSQVLEAKRKAKEGSPVKEIDISGPARFAIYECSLRGVMPTTVPYCMVKRFLLDRLIFAPAYLLVFFCVMDIQEVMNGKALERRSALAVSAWPVSNSHWLFIQGCIHLECIVVLCCQSVFLCFQFQVLFTTLVALFWNAYLASVRK